MEIPQKYGDEEFIRGANKALINRREHGAGFEEAWEVFFDAFGQGSDASENFEARQLVNETESALRRHFNDDPKLNASLRKLKKLAVAE